MKKVCFAILALTLLFGDAIAGEKMPKMEGNQKMPKMGDNMGQQKNDPYAPPEKSGLPEVSVKLDLSRTALVVIDPQVDFLSPDGVAWGLVGKSVEHNKTVPNLVRLFKAAKSAGIKVAISPHYYYPPDLKWPFGGKLEHAMHNLKMFERKTPYSKLKTGTGADWMPEFKEFIQDGKTVVTSPHKIYSPIQNDLNLQLRKNKIEQIILAGMSANLCVESHMRYLIEQGFEVVVVKDATAAAQIPDGDGYLAALINFRFIASGVWTTDEAVRRMGGGT